MRPDVRDQLTHHLEDTRSALADGITSFSRTHNLDLAEIEFMWKAVAEWADDLAELSEELAVEAAENRADPYAAAQHDQMRAERAAEMEGEEDGEGGAWVNTGAEVLTLPQLHSVIDHLGDFVDDNPALFGTDEPPVVFIDTEGDDHPVRMATIRLPRDDAGAGQVPVLALLSEAPQDFEGPS